MMVKIVLYKEDKILEIIEGVNDVNIIDKYNIKWNDGSLTGLKVNFIVVEDDVVVDSLDDIDTEGLNEAKKQKIKELKLSCSKSIYNGFASSITNADGIAYEFGLNNHDQMNFNSQTHKISIWKSLLSEGKMTQEQYDSKFPIQWKTENLGVIQFTEDEFIQVLDNGELHILEQQAKYWELEAEVHTCTKKSDVDLITWG
jgi:hypothetical protein